MGLALTELHKLPGYQTAPRIWRGGVRVLDPEWVEGALLRWQHNAEYPDIAFAMWYKEASAAAEFLANNVKVGDATGRRKPKPVIEEICKLHGFPYEEIVGPSRARVLVVARHHAIYEVARLCLHLSIAEIGRRFDKDHTSVIHAIDSWPKKAKELGIICPPSLRVRDERRRAR